MKKILFVATVVKTHINTFHLPFIEMLSKNGVQVDVAARNDFSEEESLKIPYANNYFDIDFSRFPFSIRNIKAFFKLKKIIENNGYDAIHCHTPVGGAIGRLAAITSRKSGIRIMYTAHGFHFFRGSSKINWMVYYPIEKALSYITDDLITINSEDFSLSKKRLKAKKVYLVNGVGVDTTQLDINNDSILNLKEEFNLDDDDIILLSVGELNKNKNHEVIIRSLSELNDKIKYLICGSGKELERLNGLINELKLQDRVQFLGYRNDVKRLLALADIFVFPSFREGLPLSIMEAMSSGLPIVCSRIRGNVDLVDENGGRLVEPDNISGFINEICSLSEDSELRNEMGEYNKSEVKKFSIESVLSAMEKIYFLKEDE